MFRLPAQSRLSCCQSRLLRVLFSLVSTASKVSLHNLPQHLLHCQTQPQGLSCPAAAPSPSVPNLQLCLPTSRTWHLSLQSFLRFLQAQPTSRPRSLWMAAQPPSVLSVHPAWCHTNWKRCTRHLLQLADEGVKESRSQSRLSLCCISHWQPGGVQPINHYPLSLIIQPDIYPSRCPP